MADILVVDDEETIRFVFKSFLSDEGHTVAVAESCEEAFSILTGSAFDLIFVDIILGGRTGTEILRFAREWRPGCPVVMITGQPSINTASEAVRLGAFDYIPKPVRQRALLEITERALKHKKLAEEKERHLAHLEEIVRILPGAFIKDETRPDNPEQDIEESREFHSIVGKSEQMRQTYALIEDLASVPTTVLITGETGTGKELVAAALHEGGKRSENPFVKVNCSALPESLLESELFGHVKGAFTGALQNKTGRFEKADGGTIFLDEIGDVSPCVQLRLLRVLQEKEFERVGDSTTVKVDVRVVAATNKDLQDKVKRGEFREDLYYRLKVVEIHLPTLRERKEDIPLLVEHFLEKFNARFSKKVESVSAEVIKTFMDHPWPGNIRQLEHALEHAFILCNQNVIVLDHLPLELRDIPQAQQCASEDKSDPDREAIIGALDKTAWNKAKAARLLGLSRQTMYRRIEEYGLTRAS